MATMIWMEGIQKTYRLGEVEVPILKGIDLSIELTFPVIFLAQRSRPLPLSQSPILLCIIGQLYIFLLRSWLFIRS